MAALRWTAIALFGLIAAGCQQQTSTEILPPPTFGPPTISRAPAAKPLPVRVAGPIGRPQSPAPTFPGSDPWKPSVKPNNWQWIVIHHTATPTGNLASVDRVHRDKGWDSAGYHFVIGNGSQSRDGQIEIGPRWPIQKHGAHAKSPDNRFNEQGIGIVLVGNFDERNPSSAQIESAARLVAYMMKTYRIPASRVIGHRDVHNQPGGKGATVTACPGKNVSIEAIRRRAAQLAGMPLDDGDSRLAEGVEMLRDSEPGPMSAKVPAR